MLFRFYPFWDSNPGPTDCKRGTHLPLASCMGVQQRLGPQSSIGRHIGRARRGRPVDATAASSWAYPPEHSNTGARCGGRCLVPRSTDHRLWSFTDPPYSEMAVHTCAIPVPGTDGVLSVAMGSVVDGNGPAPNHPPMAGLCSDAIPRLSLLRQ